MANRRRATAGGSQYNDKGLNVKSRKKVSMEDMPRGGFTMPRASRRHFDSAAMHVAKGNADAAKTSLKKAVIEGLSEVAFDKIHKVVTDNRQKPLGVGNGGTAEKVEPPHYDQSNQEHSALTTHEKGPIKMMGSASHQVHKTRVTTGRPVTQSIWRIAKQNGITREVMYDSKISQALDKHFLTRSQLDHSSGFNSRNFHVTSACSWITLNDIATAAGIDTGSSTPTSQDQRAYLDLMDSSSEFQFHNQSSYMDMTIKVHLVTQKGSLITLPAGRILQSVTNNDPAVQDDNAIPAWYQHGFPAAVTPPTAESGVGQTSNWDHSLKGPGLTSSPNFKDEYTIAKTVSKKLKAGDIWNFRHTHHYGSGMDVDVIYKSVQTGVPQGERYAPANYFYIFEVKGMQIEGVYRPAGTTDRETYIGTGPSYYTFESRKTLRYARTKVSNADSDAGISTGFMGYRVYQNDPLDASVAREFFVLPENITEGASPAEGEMFIPVMSDVVRRTGIVKSTPEAADDGA